MGEVIPIKQGRRKLAPGVTARVVPEGHPEAQGEPLDLRAAYADPALGVVIQSHEDAVQITLGAADGEVELWLEPAAARRLMEEIGRCADDAERGRR